MDIKNEYRTSRVWALIEAALEYFIAIMVSGAFLARLTSALGFSDSLTGILSSFVSMGCVFRLAVLFLFRNTRSAKRIVLPLQVLNELLFALIYLTPVIPVSPGMRSIVFVISFCLAYVCINVTSPSKVDWMMQLIDDHSRGIFTAKKEMISLFGGMVFTFGMGRAIDALEMAGRLEAAFVVSAVTILALTALHTFTVLAIKDVPRNEAPQASIWPSFKGLFASKSVRRIVIVNVLWTVASNCAVPFYGAYQVNELGFSMTFVSLLSIMYGVARIAFSPMFGRYADKHSFANMTFICFGIAAAGFLVNCFTVPSNGRVLYSIYYVLYAVSMAGINSALINMVYDSVPANDRRNALALTTAIGGLAGFGATCLMSAVVAHIQQNGNRLLGVNVYAAQFVSAVAFVLTLTLLAYMWVALLKKK